MTLYASPDAQLNPTPPPDRRALLDACEKDVAAGLHAILNLGNALATIRAQRLYRVTHPTFAKYCHDRWHISRAHAYRLIDAAQVTAELSPIGDKPPRESHARILKRLPLDLRAAVWREASQANPRERITAAKIKSLAEDHLEETVADAEETIAPLSQRTWPGKQQHCFTIDPIRPQHVARQLITRLDTLFIIYLIRELLIYVRGLAACRPRHAGKRSLSLHEFPGRPNLAPTTFPAPAPSAESEFPLDTDE